MAKKDGGLICIQWWHVETVEHGDQSFSFSPYGIGQLDGWILMSWAQTKTCDMGHKHKVKIWSQSMMQMEPTNPPRVPKVVWAKLKKKTKDIKQANPYPGGC